MAILNPDHLIEQAERLIVRPSNGPARQVDIRRAISAAYYSVFHCLAAMGADRYIGVTRRLNPEYGLVYRSIDHRRLRDLCVDLSKTAPPRRFVNHLPAGGMSAAFSQFAAAVTDLQQQRHMADYDPMVRLKTEDAQAAIKTAKSAMLRFSGMDKPSRDAFLSLLVFYVRP